MSSMHQPCPITRVARAPEQLWCTSLNWPWLYFSHVIPHNCTVGLLDHSMPKAWWLHEQHAPTLPKYLSWSCARATLVCTSLIWPHPALQRFPPCPITDRSSYLKGLLLRSMHST
jgi:hypothetical protein